jgi:hypothetical protein
LKNPIFCCQKSHECRLWAWNRQEWVEEKSQKLDQSFSLSNHRDVQLENSTSEKRDQNVFEKMQNLSHIEVYIEKILNNNTIINYICTW